MGRTNEFTLVADADFTEKLGCAVKVKAELVHNTPVATIATSAEAIDGIVTDITGTGLQGSPLAVAKLGDIALARIEGTVTVGDELEVGTDGKLKTKTSGVAVAKALATGKAGERIPVIIK